MRWEQSNLLFFGLAFLLLFLVSCAPAEQTSTSEEEAFLEDVAGEAAIAGQAVEIGCRTQTVISCEEHLVRGIRIEYENRRKPGGDNIVRYLKNLCLTRAGAAVELAFQVDCASATELRYCRYRCDSNEDCSEGMCVAHDTECTETDSGFDEFQQGETTGEPRLSAYYSDIDGNRARAGEVGTFRDGCWYANQVWEFGCNADNLVERRAVACGAGYECRDGACFLTPIPGCTDATADNYNADATEDDGSCIFPPEPPAPANFCYYLHANGSRYPAGTGLYSSPGASRDYGGVETEAGVFGFFCNLEGGSIVSHICGERYPYTSGEGVTLGGRYFYPFGSSCIYACNNETVECCTEEEASFSCSSTRVGQPTSIVACGSGEYVSSRADLCSRYGCNEDTGRCCRETNAEATSSCSGTVLLSRNVTYTDCNPDEPLVEETEMDCAGIPSDSPYTCSTNFNTSRCAGCGGLICETSTGYQYWTYTSCGSDIQIGIVTGPGCP